jgi:hypothetical protein
MVASAYTHLQLGVYMHSGYWDSQMTSPGTIRAATGEHPLLSGHEHVFESYFWNITWHHLHLYRVGNITMHYWHV